MALARAAMALPASIVRGIQKAGTKVGLYAPAAVDSLALRLGKHESEEGVGSESQLGEGRMGGRGKGKCTERKQALAVAVIWFSVAVVVFSGKFVGMVIGRGRFS